MSTMEMNRVVVSQAMERLQSQVKGSVYVPGDIGYDEARAAWNLTVNQHPSVIVIASSAYDIAEAVRYAQAENLGIAVMSTGHGVALPANDAMLIVTSRMKEVSIDVFTQTAHIGAGVKWGQVLEAAQRIGLAPLLGSSPEVGAIGYTLGGGMGWLARKFGLAVDSVTYFELVTSDARIIRASETENADLFWAMRGGGGAFGIVTAMGIKLYPVSMVYAGNLLYPVSEAKEVYKHFREWIANAPDELTSSISIMNFPPIPAVPEFLRGQTAVIVRGAYVGSMEDGEALLKFWTDWKAPMANLWGPLPFTQAELISNDPKDPSPGYATSMWLRELSDDAIETLVARIPASPVVFAEIRHAGGAMSRVRKDFNAYGNRDGQLILEMVGMAPAPEILAAVKQYTALVKQELQPAATGGVYINFMDGEEKWNRTKDAFTPENFARLQTVKAKYDPNNMFRFSFNIAPKKA